MNTYKKRKLAGVTGYILLTISVIFYACDSSQSATTAVDNDAKQPYTIPDSLLKTITIDSVKQGEVFTNIVLTGQVDFNQDRQVNLFPIVSGNIQDIKVELGDYVTAGQPIATIKSSEMAGYSNNLTVAQTNLAATKKQLDATKALYASGLATALDSTNAQVNYEQAVAQLEMAKRVLKINGDNTNGDFIVKSPVSGFIVQKLVTNGQAIRTDNGGAMFTISDLQNVWVWANVYENNIDKIHLGDNVDITTITYPNRVFKGKIDKFTNALDPTSKVLRVRVIIDNPDYALKPQMYASISVKNTDQTQAVFVPTSAMVFDASRYYVLVYKGNGKAEITPVEKLNTWNNNTYLSAGIKPGDEVIASKTLQIFDQLNN